MIKRTLCFSNPAWLSLSNGQMIVKFSDIEQYDVSKELKTRVSFPIEDLGIVILDCRQITITQGLIEKLLENKCALITCDSHHLPVGLMLPLCGNTLQNERFRNQTSASLPLKKQLWQQTIQSKIKNQAAVLKFATGNEHKNLLIWAKSVKSGDTDNLEARAAAYYWKSLFINDPHFVRNQEHSGLNALLNYGYAILRATVARSLVCCGLLPTLGIHHHNRYNAYCLADDIMEPYRPYVDKKVLEIANSFVFEEITTEIKSHLLSIPTIDVVVKGVKHPLMVATSITAISLEKCFAGESRSLSYPEI